MQSLLLRCYSDILFPRLTAPPNAWPPRVSWQTPCLRGTAEKAWITTGMSYQVCALLLWPFLCTQAIYFFSTRWRGCLAVFQSDSMLQSSRSLVYRAYIRQEWDQLGSIPSSSSSSSSCSFINRLCESPPKYVRPGRCVLLNISHDALLGDSECSTVDCALLKRIYWLNLFPLLSFWLRSDTRDWFEFPWVLRSGSVVSRLQGRRSQTAGTMKWSSTISTSLDSLQQQVGDKREGLFLLKVGSK